MNKFTSCDDCISINKCFICVHKGIHLTDNFEAKPKKWKPKGGNYVFTTNSTCFSRNTLKQAESLAKKLRTLARLDSWICEHGYEKEFVEDEDNYYIFLNVAEDYWYISSQSNAKYINTAYLTEVGAKELAEKLNNKGVEL